MRKEFTSDEQWQQARQAEVLEQYIAAAKQQPPCAVEWNTDDPKEKTMINTKRAEYMSGNLTHDEYYGILVEFLDENRLWSMLPGNRTPEQWRELFEEDQHLNNVPLKQWDFLDWRVRQLPTGKTKEDLKAITGVGGWSISDSVCVLKCAARRYAGVTLTPRKINR